MALCAIRVQVILLVIRIRSGVVVIVMASEAGVWCIVVIAHMTIKTLIRNCDVRSIEHVILVVIKG